MLSFGILGMNARNILYIKKFNPKKAIHFANNKISTKSFLAERWIPVPHTYGTIKNRNELSDFNFFYLPKKDFVVKPNKWSRWRWIYVAKFLEDIKEHEKPNKKSGFIWDQVAKLTKFAWWLPDYDHYYKTWWEVLDDNTFRRHMIDILDWKHSMTYGNDKILIEEKLVAGWWFQDFCEHWLADIRIIIFNLVPVAAMIRIPTKESWWKANLDRWWIGLGIEIWTWKITSMVHENKILKSNFPKEFAKFYNKKVPYRNDILFLSSKIQFFVNLWYLALDRVITEDWPKLLEMNARAWLKVQNISSLKLQNRLKKIWDLKINDPEKWVEIAKSLFTSEKSDLTSNRKILHLSQYATLKIWEAPNEMVANVDLNKSENYISTKMFDLIQNNACSDIGLDIYDSDVIIKDIKFIAMEDLPDNKIIIWKSTASNYFIKPTNQIVDTIDIINPEKIMSEEKDILHMIDESIHKLWKKLILAPILRPTNYFQEFDHFARLNGKYDPQFEYNRPDSEKMDNIKNELLKIKEQLLNDNIKSSFKRLFDEKIDELLYRWNLIKAYKNKDYTNILLYNEKIFGKFDKKLLEISKEKIFEENPANEEDLWKFLTMLETQKIIENYLDEKWMKDMNIITSSTSFSRMSIVRWKTAKIKLWRWILFREKELPSILAHEIDTHLVRYMNGRKSWWNILADGTGWYLQDEEWLAVYNATKKLPAWYEKTSIHKKYFLVNEAQKYSFSKLVDVLRFIYPDWNIERLFKTAIRMKKWIEDTSIVSPWTVFYKDKIYLDGYSKVKKWIENGWEANNLYKWKMKISDLDLFE